jgi:hypothetical protein
VIRTDLEGTNRRELASAHGAYSVVDAPGTVYFTDNTLDGDVSVIADP